MRIQNLVFLVFFLSGIWPEAFAQEGPSGLDREPLVRNSSYVGRRQAVGFPAGRQSMGDGEPFASTAAVPFDYKRLLRPRVSFGFDWEPVSDGLGLESYDVSITLPTYPIFGPPPPMITTAYSYTHLTSDPALELPGDLHEASVGLGWVRRINRRWVTRWMINATYASDLQNTGSDAWQIRGGGFGVYRPDDRWSFAIGALATGRSDIPVLPAVGFIFEPSDYVKLNLMMPEPRISWWLCEREGRQLWAYLGGGIGGGNWAVSRPGEIRDRLNYREWRLVAGWEWKPVQVRGQFRPMGRVFLFEVGYALGREINFKSGAPDIDLGEAFLLRTGFRF